MHGSAAARRITARRMALADQRLSFVVAAGLLLASLLVAGTRLHEQWPFTIDDAYISARYARNLARGYGPVYNPGEQPVEGTSNLLFVSLLAAGTRAGADPIVFAKLIGLASMIAVLLLASHMTRALVSEPALVPLPVVLLLLNGSFVFWATGGLETTFYGLLLLLCLHFLVFSTGRYGAALAGVFMALALLTRLDALFIPVALLPGLLFFGRRRGALATALVTFFVIAAPAMLWTQRYYGTIFPNCGFVKTAIPIDFRAPITTIERLAATQERNLPLEFLRLNATVVAFTLIAGWFLTRRRTGEHGPDDGALFFWLVVALTGMTLTAYLAIAAWMPGYRYYVPLLPPLAMCATVGFDRLLWSRPGRIGRLRLLWLVGFVCAVFYSQLAHAESLRAFAARVAAWMQEDHHAVGAWLKANTPPDAYIAIFDAGIVPYTSERRTLDLGGLNDRAMAVYFRRQDVEGGIRHVLGQRPDFVVLSRILWIDKWLLRDARFNRDYELVFTSGSADSKASMYHLLVFRRRSGPGGG